MYLYCAVAGARCLCIKTKGECVWQLVDRREFCGQIVVTLTFLGLLAIDAVRANNLCSKTLISNMRCNVERCSAAVHMIICAQTVPFKLVASYFVYNA